MPAAEGTALENFNRTQSLPTRIRLVTAKMGRDLSWLMPSTALESQICVCDASIHAARTTGTTMAPCVVIGERAAEILKPS